MKQNITKRGLFAVAAKTIDEKKPEVVALMQTYGVDVSADDELSRIDAAFLALIRTSRGFRKDFANLATSAAEEIQQEYSGLSGYHSLSGSTTTSASTLQGRGLSTTTTNPLQPTGGVTIQNRNPENKVSSGKGKFGSWVSGVFDKDTMQNIINTGLGIWAYQKTGGAGVGGMTPIDQGRQDYTGGGTGGTTGGGGEKPPKGLSVGAIVGISLVGLALVGGVIYAVTKK